MIQDLFIALTQINIFKIAMATKKNKEFADLLVPIKACPFEKSEQDCPFVNFWSIESLEQHLLLIDKLSEKELLELREHHKVCRDYKLSKGEVIVNL